MLNNESENEKELIPIKIGDDRTIWMLGDDAQTTLRQASKTVAAIVASDASEKALDLIDETVEKLEGAGRKSIFSVKSKTNAKKKYEDIFKCIEELSVQFQVRQVQISKDLMILEHVEQKLKTSYEDLGNNIQKGDNLLASENDELTSVVSEFDDGELLSDWFNRLRARVNELRTGQIIAMQSLTQVRLIQKNQRELFQKINETLTTTIPLWRNQVATAYHVERLSDETRLQNETVEKVAAFTARYLADNYDKLGKNKLSHTSDHIESTDNDQLTEMLRQIENIEKQIQSLSLRMDKSTRN